MTFLILILIAALMGIGMGAGVSVIASYLWERCYGMDPESF